jgi:TPR repeat protein/CHAT domain-containing protein
MAYRDLATHEDRELHLHGAIRCYREMLRETRGLWELAQRAELMADLAAFYSDLPGDHYKRVAIRCYKRVLRVYTEHDHPECWATMNHNLGVLYLEMKAAAQKGMRNDTDDKPGGPYVALAIACCEAALRVRTWRALPLAWAATMHVLAGAYTVQAGSYADENPDMLGANLARAVEYYREILRVVRRQEAPLQWARTMNDLSRALWLLYLWGDRASDHLAQAIAGYQEALQVRIPALFPLDCLLTLRNLSLLYLDEGQWSELLATCEQGIAVAEQLRTAALTAGERTRVLSENSALFDRAVISSVALEQYRDALIYAERGKTRHLLDLLLLRDVHPQNVPSTEWQAYQQQLHEAQALERRMTMAPQDEQAAPQDEQAVGEHFAQAYAELGRMRAELHDRETRFRAADPLYLPTAPPLTFAEVHAIVRQTQAVLVVFRVTDAGTFVFLLSGDDADITAAQVVPILQFTTARLQDLVAPLLTSSGALALQERFGEVMQAISTELLQPVHARLQDYYPQATRLILVPNKELHRLPLHAAWLDSAGSPHCWLDAYEISYAPSCAVLARCLHRERQRSGRTVLCAVQNPDPTDKDWQLPLSDWEVEEVAGYFETPHVLAGADATPEQVTQYMPQAHEVLLSCHGTYDPADVFASHLRLHGGKLLDLSAILRLDVSHAWLVVLSGCETAQSEVRDRVDEVQGLHTAFLIAGAATVVGSLWRVDELATTLLMQRFHQYLYHERLPKAQALREAQRWLRDLSVAEVRQLLEDKSLALDQVQARERLGKVHIIAQRFEFDLRKLPEDGKPFAEPYYWAAFQCIGAGGVPVASPVPPVVDRPEHTPAGQAQLLDAGIVAYRRGAYDLAFRTFSRLAARGHAAAQHNLGVLHAEGRGVEHDDRQAIVWWQRAAQQGYVEAQYNLGTMYARGRGVAQNNRQACFWYQQAAEQQFARAQSDLGLMYAEGRGVTQDDRLACRWSRRAALQDDRQAQYQMGMFYATGRGVRQNYHMAAMWWQRAAEQGHADAQYNLALLYDYGRGVAQDARQAFQWFHCAAEQGMAPAQYNLSLMYAQGRGVLQDDDQAVQWAQRAAMQGHADAQYDLGVRCITGGGVPQNDSLAAQWWQQAAERGHADAQYNLSVLYNKGRGVAQDVRQAFQWVQRAADQGHTQAQFQVGCLYFQGRILAQDFRQAVQWFQQAALQGHAQAQCDLGTMYFRGDGVAQDDGFAVLWFQCAAAHGDQRAQDTLRLMAAAGRTAAAPRYLQRAQAYLRAAGYDPGPCDRLLAPGLCETLRRYQRLQGLPVTGILDVATLQRLQAQS